MPFSIASVTGKGGRDHNEDAVWLHEQQGLHLALLADGCGGYKGGELASRRVCETLADRAKTLHGRLPRDMTALVRRCEEAVVQLQKEKSGDMCTTLALLAARGRRARAVHVGDSRIYHFRGGKVLYQSEDHSLARLACLMGEITPKQIRDYPNRNVLVYALGAASIPKVKTETLPVLKHGDGLLLCSDGFWEYVLEDEMAFDLCKAENARQWLDGMLTRLAARAGENHDNLSAIAMLYLDETCKEGLLCETSF